MKKILALACCTFFGASVAQAGLDFSLSSSFFREGTVNGLGGVVANVVSVTNHGAGSVLSAIRPNGQSDWTPGGSAATSLNLRQLGPGAWNGTSFDAPYMDIAAAAAWNTSNGRGAWSVTNDSGVYDFDTAAEWIAPEARVFNQLTSASAQQYFDVLQNGLTGTYTFNLAQAAVSGSIWVLSNPGATSIQFGQLQAGATSFTVTINTALANSMLLQLVNTVHGPNMTMTGGVAYGTFGSVPAPGAIALFGLVGLAGRRRRN